MISGNLSNLFLISQIAFLPKNVPNCMGRIVIIIKNEYKYGTLNNLPMLK